ncbi:MAG: hypothetical protein VX700_08195 [Pseudomonadota bacterium]|nr:hypothetical protein [Pseudomonadota bacterium]
MSIYGAYQFAKFRREAAEYFENSPEAFWQSFYSALITLPVYTLLVFINFADRPVNAPGLRILIVESSAYVIGWVIFPLVMISLTDSLNRFDRYFRFIAAWNWAILIQVSLFLAVSALITSGIVPAQVAGFASLVAVIMIFVYQGFIATALLDIRPAAAFLVVAVDFLLALGLKFITQSFYAGFPIG